MTNVEKYKQYLNLDYYDTWTGCKNVILNLNLEVQNVWKSIDQIYRDQYNCPNTIPISLHLYDQYPTLKFKAKKAYIKNDSDFFQSQIAEALANVEKMKSDFKEYMRVTGSFRDPNIVFYYRPYWKALRAEKEDDYILHESN